MKAHKLNLNKEVEIVCKKHGSFSQKPCDHLNGFGCPICDGEKDKEIKGRMINKVSSECKNETIKMLTSRFREKEAEFEKEFESSLLIMALENSGFLPKSKSHVSSRSLLIGVEMKVISAQLKELGINVS